MGSVKFECPYCKQHLEIDAAYAGANCNCPVCQGEFLVPELLPAEPVGTVPEPPAVDQANYMPPPAVRQGYEVPPPAVGRGSEAANYSGYDDDKALRRRLSRTYIMFRFFNIGVVAFPLLVFVVGVVLSQLISGLSGGEIAIGFLALLGIAFLTWLVARIMAWFYWFLLLYRIWDLIPPREAATTPGKAVGFQFIPFFNIYWNFIAYGELGKYLTMRTGYSEPRTWATLYSWFPLINILVGGIGFVAYLFMPLIDMAMMKSFVKGVRIWRNWN